MRDERDVRLALPRRGQKALSERLKRLTRHNAPLDPAFFLPSRALPAERVEFPVACQHIERAVREFRRVHPHQQFMRVGREPNCLGIRQSQFVCDVRLCARHHFAEHTVPFAVRQRGRIHPRFHVPVIRSVRP